MQRRLFLLSLLGLIALAIADPVPKPKLNGVTLLIEPYVTEKDGKLTGFAIDLIEKIAQKAGFEYELKQSPDGRYGVKDEQGNWNGMIGEVQAKRADFAIADITITQPRAEVVDFTEPFFSTQLSALIRKDTAEGVTTLEDLVKKNELAAKSTPPGQSVTFGVVNSGATYARLSETTDNIGQAIFTSIQANPASKVKSTIDGLEKVKDGNYAMIVESLTAEYISGRNCNLTALSDPRGIYPRDYGLALPKGSQHLTAFNKAIQELKADGTIATLKNVYWIKNC